ncbi:MAG: hypothetical protein ACYS0G_11775 [Planctomycetota bacterium]|jgi:hypothetical protein
MTKPTTTANAGPTSVSTASGIIAPIDRWRLTVKVRLSEGGPVVDQEPVTPADLDQVVAEAWFHAHLRRGDPDFRFRQVEALMEPLVDADVAGPATITGFILHVTTPSGEPYRRRYSTLSIPDPAQRASVRLIAAGRMKVGDVFYYEIEAAAGAAAARRPAGAPAGLKVKHKDPPLAWLEVPLGVVLEEATPVGTHDPRWCHVLYTREAREKSERFSRRGGRNMPATETGAALVGTLCLCPDTKDMFVIVTDALEVVDAEATKFSLEYTSRSWARIQAVVTAMQNQPATATWRLVGQAHGHNFLPANGAPPCQVCAKAPVCGRTSAFVSVDDVNWTRAVFSRQPFAVSHIYGLTARHMRPNPDEVDVLFGISDGRLLPRSYHRIDEFDPARWSPGRREA